MTWVDLKAKIGDIIYQSPKRLSLSSTIAFEKKEVKVFFDFPLTPGGQKEFKIVSVTDNGIMIRNDSCERPAGHP